MVDISTSFSVNRKFTDHAVESKEETAETAETAETVETVEAFDLASFLDNWYGGEEVSIKDIDTALKIHNKDFGLAKTNDNPILYTINSDLRYGEDALDFVITSRINVNGRIVDGTQSDTSIQRLLNSVFFQLDNKS